MADHHARLTVSADTRHAEASLKRVGTSASVAGAGVRGLGASTTKTGAQMAALRKEANSLKMSFAGRLGLTAGLIGAVAMLDQAADRAVELNNVYKTLKIGIDDAAAAVANQVDKLTLAKNANRLMQAGVIDSEQQFTAFAKAVANAADNAGVDLTQALERSTKALINGNVDGLGPRLALTFDQRTAERELAKDLGVTTSELTKQQRQQAALKEFTEGTTEQLGEFGGATQNVAVRLVALRNKITDAGDAVLMVDQNFKDLAVTLRQDITAQFAEAGDTAAQAEVKSERFFLTIAARAVETAVPMGHLLGITSQVNKEFGLIGGAMKAFERDMEKARARDEASRQRAAQVSARARAMDLGDLGFESAADRVAREQDEIVLDDTMHSERRGTGRPRTDPRLAQARNAKRLRALDGARQDAFGQAELKRAQSAQSLRAIEGSRTRAGAGDRLQDIERQIAARERQLQLMEAEKASLSETLSLRGQIADLQAQGVEQQALAGQISAEERRESLAEIHHRSELDRVQARIDAREAELQATVSSYEGMAQVAAVTAQAANDTTGLIVDAASRSGASAKQVEAIQRVASSSVLAIQGFQYAAESAAAFAGLNPVFGTAKAIASGIAFARSAMALSTPTQSMRGGGGGRGGGAFGASGAFSGGGAPVTRGRIDSDVVGSPMVGSAANAGPPRGASASATGGTTININGPINGSVDNAFLDKLDRDLSKRRADRRFA